MIALTMERISAEELLSGMGFAKINGCKLYNAAGHKIGNVSQPCNTPSQHLGLWSYSARDDRTFVCLENGKMFVRTGKPSIPMRAKLNGLCREGLQVPLYRFGVPRNAEDLHKELHRCPSEDD